MCCNHAIFELEKVANKEYLNFVSSWLEINVMIILVPSVIIVGFFCFFLFLCNFYSFIYFFFPPQAILAAVIWVALYGMFKQFKDVYKYFKLSAWDGVRRRGGVDGCGLILVGMVWGRMIAWECGCGLEGSHEV